jgi:hypothetical protein
MKFLPRSRDALINKALINDGIEGEKGYYDSKK